ncbi:MAG: hypothetical protein ACO4CS_03870 [bacterium]
MVIFDFTDELRELALQEASRRQSINEKQGRKGRNQAPEKGDRAFQMHLFGAAGEIAVAYYMGMEMSLFSDLEPVRDSCDLPGIDVKTRTRHHYDLLVQLSDDLSKTFVLVTIENQQTRIIGWIKGADIKQVATIHEYVPGRPAYIIKQKYLNPPWKLRTTVFV